MSEKSLLKEERGSFAYFVAFIFLAVTLLFLFAVGIPLVININTEFYAAGETIIGMTDETINEIQDVNARTQFQDTSNAMQNSIADQIDVLSIFFQYGWLIIIVVIVLILFMASRQQVEGSGLR